MVGGGGSNPAIQGGQNTSVDLSELEARVWTVHDESRVEQARPEPDADMAT